MMTKVWYKLCHIFMSVSFTTAISDNMDPASTNMGNVDPDPTIFIYIKSYETLVDWYSFEYIFICSRFYSLPHTLTDPASANLKNADPDPRTKENADSKD